MGVTHRLRIPLACAAAGAVLLALALCAASFAQEPTPTPDAPVQVDQNQLVDPAATVTPEPTPEPAATPTPTAHDETSADKRGATQPLPSPARHCKAGHRTSGMLAVGGSVGSRPGSSPTGLALVIGGGALALFTMAFALRRGTARRRQEAPAAKSPLEIGSPLVALLGGGGPPASPIAPRPS